MARIYTYIYTALHLVFELAKVCTEKFGDGDFMPGTKNGTYTQSLPSVLAVHIMFLVQGPLLLRSLITNPTHMLWWCNLHRGIYTPGCSARVDCGLVPFLALRCQILVAKRRKSLGL